MVRNYNDEREIYLYMKVNDAIRNYVNDDVKERISEVERHFKKCMLKRTLIDDGELTD